MREQRSPNAALLTALCAAATPALSLDAPPRCCCWCSAATATVGLPLPLPLAAAAAG
ncbi:hypothetical protein [Nocardia pseudovaccinii]|uniref:hypothetical protein n=1 Tax=Nocardia pseudovaccinii TaxID=189540 RepID=UPI000AD989A6|nr:hypothetical protein [Nocardia pseudovaccinii]